MTARARRASAFVILLAALLGGCSAPTNQVSSAALVAHSGDALHSVPYQAAESSRAATSTAVFLVDPARQRCDRVVRDEPADVPVQEERAIGADIYFTDRDQQWYRFDQARLTSSSLLLDPCGVDEIELLLGGVSQAIRTSTTQYQGTIDLRRATDMATATAVKQRGTTLTRYDAATVPFTAVLDDQQRLVSLTYALSPQGQGAGAILETYAFSRYGVPVDIPTPPTARTQPATEAMYKLYG